MSTQSSVLVIITKEFTIYFGISVLVGGVIGAILNIIVFLSLKTFRQSSCAFFLTIMSFVNIGQLLTGLLSRIMISGYNYDFTESSPVYCKFRFYCLQVCSLTSYSCMCLATIDQFLATSIRPQWRQVLTIKRAHFLSLIFFVIWLIHGIPTLIFYNPVVSPRTGSVSCIATNAIFQKYNIHGYSWTLAGILPIVITVLFGSLAYLKVRQISYRTVPLVRRELDKQLTSMVLVQVVHNFLVLSPYVSMQIVLYATNFSIQSPNYVELVSSMQVTGLAYYLYFASPFYIYVCVSKRFRQQLIYVLVGSCMKKQQTHIAVGTNQIAPQTLSESYL